MTWASLPSWRTPGPGAIIVNTGVIDNMDRVCLGEESWCGPELTRLCGEGEGDSQRDEHCEDRGEDNCGQSGGGRVLPDGQVSRWRSILRGIFECKDNNDSWF